MLAKVLEVGRALMAENSGRTDGASMGSVRNDRVRSAINALREVERGAEESVAKNLRPDLVQYGGSPDVHFIWGNRKKGLQHFGLKRGTEVMARVIETVATGTDVKYIAGNKTARISKDGFTAILSLDEHGKQKTWLLTGREEGRPDAGGEVGAQSAAMQNAPIFSRDELGASLNSIVHRLDNSAIDGDDIIMGNVRDSSIGGAIELLRGATSISNGTAIVKDMLSTSRTFSLLNRTIGTQFHKATKSAPFKRVFDAYNNQTDDTAHYAIEAESLAPNVLQRLDGFGDVWKALSNSGTAYKADLDAISKPLFANIEGQQGIQQYVFTDAELAQVPTANAAWGFGLNPRQIGMVKEVRRAVDTSLERLAQTMAASIGEDAGLNMKAVRNMSLADTVAMVKEVLQRQQEDAQLRADVKAAMAGLPSTPIADKTGDIFKNLDGVEAQTAHLQKSGYMPAMRFGNYTLTMRDPAALPDTPPEHFQMFESETARNIAAKRLAVKHPGRDIERGVMNEDRFKESENYPLGG